MTAPLDFLDSNVLVYAFSTDPRSAAAEALLATGCTIGVQGLNEFTHIARRKLGMSWPETAEALVAIRTLCSSIVSLDLETHSLGIEIASRHGFSVYDGLMLAAALQAGCETFWSEDMQHERLVEGGLRIRNPFL